MTRNQLIQEQVRLPIGVAMGVVMQGIRIRLGRSIVTLTGVVCGIAFLMSIMTGQLIKKGVGVEDGIREEVDRMRNFMHADLPALKDTVVSLVVAGPVSEAEMRLLEGIAAEGVSGFETLGTVSLPRPLPRVGQVAPDAFASASVMVLLVGDGAAPKEQDFSGLIDRGVQKSLATTFPRGRVPQVEDDRLVLLSRELTEEEIDAKALKASQDRFRNIWIGIISLMVTVIGIANAMLMSVTERFREIGTMKCLGAMSSFIRRIFLLESSLMGLVGGFLGAIGGALFSCFAYAATYGFGMVAMAVDMGPILAYGGISVCAGVILSMVAAVYPAQVASNMVPAMALRSTV